MVLLRKPDAEPRKGIISYRAVALTSVMSLWYATRIILVEKKEPREMKQVHVGGIDGISCQHLQVMTQLQKRLELQEDRRKNLWYGRERPAVSPAWTSRRPLMRGRKIWRTLWEIKVYTVGLWPPVARLVLREMPHSKIWSAFSRSQGAFGRGGDSSTLAQDGDAGMVECGRRSQEEDGSAY